MLDNNGTGNNEGIGIGSSWKNCHVIFSNSHNYEAEILESVNHESIVFLISPRSYNPYIIGMNNNINLNKTSHSFKSSE